MKKKWTGFDLFVSKIEGEKLNLKVKVKGRNKRMSMFFRKGGGFFKRIFNYFCMCKGFEVEIIEGGMTIGMFI